MIQHHLKFLHHYLVMRDENALAFDGILAFSYNFLPPIFTFMQNISQLLVITYFAAFKPSTYQTS